ncbi:SHOCT domain-containing protein [Streptomyces sp. NPDC094438]|uniref:SHOCT domain-containing protein n=1 Tax=Streptomyces sp. NPDC094438 TaxID=3366061 RepID=UPI0038249F2A
MRHHWDGRGMNGWGYPAAGLTLLVLMVLVAMVTIALLRRGNDMHQDRTPAAERLLAERFARGELDDEEYRRQLAVLREPRTSGKGR